MVINKDSWRSSTEDPCKGLGFGVLNDEERTVVEARAVEIEALELDEPTRKQHYEQAIALHEVLGTRSRSRRCAMRMGHERRVNL